MYVVLGTVLGVVVLVVVVCLATCTWRHQQQPRRAVGMSIVYLLIGPGNGSPSATNVVLVLVLVGIFKVLRLFHSKTLHID